MANQNQVERVQQGVAAWNTWRKQHPDEVINLSFAGLSFADLNGADLSGADLNGTDLSEADLNGTDLSGADLSKADLSKADLNGANLNGADLSFADLSEANLRLADLSKADLRLASLRLASLNGANLSEANLRFANLNGANLNGANLRFANLNGAYLSGTILANLDLCTVRGLIEIHHQGPSVVSLYSIQLPQDGSALHFLRGTGIPDEWIDFYRSTMMHPIEYQSVFISYSSDDESISKRLHADLQANGVRCWFAPHNLKPGDFFRQEIDKAIHLQDKLLLILSEHSIQSTWVEYEVNHAIDREIAQKRTILFPLRVDETVLHTKDQWAADIRSRRHIGNFTNWKDHTTYQCSFDQLLKQLKADTP
jgi:TIR domain/Pentapeptide repeats (8 copies)